MGFTASALLPLICVAPLAACMQANSADFVVTKVAGEELRGALPVR